MVEVVHDPAPQTIEHPGLRALYDYWEGRRAGGHLDLMEPFADGRRELDDDA